MEAAGEECSDEAANRTDQNKVKNNIHLIRQSSSKELLFCVYMQSMSLSYRTKRVGENPYNTR